MLLFISILAICIISRSEADFFIPSIPHLQEYFGLTDFATELSLSFNFTGYCIGGLLSGMLGDRFNQRTIITYNLTVFVMATFVCMVAPTYEILLFGRLLQGFSIAGATVIGYVLLILDNKFSDQLKKLGLINGILTLIMAIVPTIGGHLGLYKHWRFNFLAVLALSIIALYLTRLSIKKIPKVLPVPRKERETTYPVSYITLLKSGRILIFAATLCFIMTPYWVFISMSPIYYVSDLHVPLIEYIYYKNLLSIIFGVVSIASGLLVRVIGGKRCLSLSIKLCLVSVFCQLIIVLRDINDPVFITASMGILAAGAAFLINFLYANALNSAVNDICKTSALIHSVRLVFTSVCLSVVSHFYTGSFSVIGIALITMLLTGIAFVIYLDKKGRLDLSV